MAKYLFIGNYTPDGAKGLLKAGGTARREAIKKVVESVGGTLESLYWAFGADDAFIIADLPSHAAAASVSLKISGSGAAGVRTTPIITAEDLDAASNLSPEYRPPGS